MVGINGSKLEDKIDKRVQQIEDERLRELTRISLRHLLKSDVYAVSLIKNASPQKATQVVRSILNMNIELYNIVHSEIGKIEDPETRTSVFHFSHDVVFLIQQKLIELCSRRQIEVYDIIALLSAIQHGTEITKAARKRLDFCGFDENHLKEIIEAVIERQRVCAIDYVKILSREPEEIARG